MILVRRSSTALWKLNIFVSRLCLWTTIRRWHVADQGLEFLSMRWWVRLEICLNIQFLVTVCQLLPHSVRRESTQRTNARTRRAHHIHLTLIQRAYSNYSFSVVYLCFATHFSLNIINFKWITYIYNCMVTFATKMT